MVALLMNAIAAAQSPNEEEIKNSYGDDSQKIQLVAEYSDHAVLAWAAYRDQGALSIAADRGWNPMIYVVRERGKLRSTQAAKPSDEVVAIMFRMGDPMAFGAQDKYVTAFTGSDFGKLDDWFANGQVVLPMIPSDRIKEAVELARNLEGAVAQYHPGQLRHFQFVGHSLGGRIAMVARHATGRDAIVFNSSPLSARELGYLARSKAGPDSKEVAFRSPQDPLIIADPGFAKEATEVANIAREKIVTGFREVYPNSLIPDPSGIPDPAFTTSGSTPAMVEGSELVGDFRDWVLYNHSIGVLANAMQEVRTAFPTSSDQESAASSSVNAQAVDQVDEKTAISCNAAAWEGLVENIADLFECDSIRAMQSLAEGRRISFYVSAPKFSQGAFSASMRANPTYRSVFHQRSQSRTSSIDDWLNVTQNQKSYTVRCSFPTDQIGRLKEGITVEVEATLDTYSGNTILLACSL